MRPEKLPRKKSHWSEAKHEKYNKEEAMMDFNSKCKTYAELVNKALEGYVPEKDVPEGNIYKAMRYSLMAGGKRLRPILMLSVCEMLGGSIDDALPYACAIEMIHTYSLIHDDLPVMDNDDYRRGRLTNHKVFGEAMAVLAGDALLNYAFEIMLEDAIVKNDSLLNKVKAMKIISNASGASGMIGGQVVDMESVGKTIHEGILRYMYQCKTGALIKASILSAAALCGANIEEEEILGQFSEKIGLAFQIKDDILDVEGNFNELGKSIGSDAANMKTTFVTMYGIEKSKEFLSKVTRQAIACIKKLKKYKPDFLISLAEYIAERIN
jgi:geranylgeranyl diphosphate synthase type II